MQKSFKEDKPTLYVVATPIGNLGDISYRAIEVLNDVDIILAEDTRTSGVLLNHYQIKKPMMSYHEFNKEAQENKVIDLLHEGKNLALISDAGTPGISDPGYEIIKAVIDSGFHAVSIPGPSAILAALVISGLIIQPFTFIGFLPRKPSDMKKMIESYQNRKETVIIYESPMRIQKTLNTIYSILGNRNITLSRELTKTFETIIRTTLDKAVSMDHNPKGEYVIIIEGNHNIQTHFDLTIEEHVQEYIKLGHTEKDAMKIVAQERNIKKSEVYKAIKIDS
ncbi:16S rRNA (cytidine(1402)-2'-O)-methyltransferase [Peloplasma aerotolerans]|uniref:Ribosomal RNA small subunit methyltransferase I n=1 Tax=Peloplasma aerotolerans TaxID=3044389 RepID=A0AAW6UE54_9MOLU|nr:16S rRNA (cytidine(1402)-2'-O)-methyltransferase [Mariniplasma sp. M4Ah]MDI6453283.1 16S rRNA (cytidine(1402)-2'-O)-methyltransferase [Mariniplasma sp. M4Ah]